MIKKILLLVVTALILTSCGSDDESVNLTVTEALLVGDWNVVDLDSEIKTKANAEGFSVESVTTAIGEDFDFVYSFSQNPNIVTTEGSYTLVTTTTVNGRTESTRNENIGSVDGLNSGTWTLDGNIITIQDNNSSSSEESFINSINKAEIIEFSENSMKIKIADKQDINEDGLNINIDIEFFLTFERKQ